MFFDARAAPDATAPPPARVWDPAITIPTLVGSLLSLCTTTAVIVCWVCFGGHRRREFRYALILNLTFAEFINTLNNSISGLYVVARQGMLKDGAACDFNGWVGQFSVQAVDFSILAISIVTLLTIQLKSYIIYASTITKTLICIAIWIAPLTTSILAWQWDLYEPVTGNWCWIGREHETLRYALTHGWRFGIIIISFCIYVFVFAYMHKRLKGRSFSNTSYSSYDDLPYEISELPPGARESFPPRGPATHSGRPGVTFDMDSRAAQAEPGDEIREPAPLPRRHRRGTSSFSFGAGARFDLPLGLPPTYDNQFPSDDKNEPTGPLTRFRIQRTGQKVDRDVWQMVLLNLYPVTYLILWLPGIVNRLAEATGNSIRVLAIIQCSTQFIGLANASVYMYKEHRKDIKELLSSLTRTNSVDHR